ncbi:MAG TPA: glycosyltransferase family 4 protein [Candidatus Acidoferrum sp.]|nr:glycosyltransferase family 4 protein [Candidatus Acidoferrum sp.]
MKLLIYSHFFAPSVGGVESIVRSLASGVAEMRSPGGAPEFEVTLATQTPAGDFDDSPFGFPVVRNPNLFRLWRLIRRSDVIHVAGPSLAPLLLARLAGKPAVIEHHGYQAMCPNGVFIQQPERHVCPGHFQARRYRECVRCLTHETSRWRSLLALLRMFPRRYLTSHATANLVISRHILKRQEFPHSSVLYYGIEDLLPNVAVSCKEHPPAEKITFAYVGRLVPEKGLPVLLAAAKILQQEGRSFEILLIGDGPERASLESILARGALSSNVHITGFLTGQALAAALASVRVVVMPSVWEETAGLAAIEQMMRGRLVIASDIGGLGEVVAGTGLKCPPGDAAALAGAMREVLERPAIISSLGEAARARAQRMFRRERMIAEHAEVYRRVAAPHRA